jgi:hypothetical protein
MPIRGAGSVGGLVCAAAAVLALSAGAQRTARMALPDGLADRVESMTAEGFGGLNSGRYRLDRFEGEFTRIESRWAIADPVYAQNRGKSSFTLVGPGFEERVSAACEMRKGTVQIGVVTFDPDKMTYECEFERGGATLDAKLVLGEPRPENWRARLLARSERRGELLFDGTRIAIRSVHGYAGSRLTAPMPVGYLLAVDDRDVGAIELTDVNPTVLLPVDEQPEVRAAALLAALALAVLRDPANSALED